MGTIDYLRLHTQSQMFFEYTERATLVLQFSKNRLQHFGPKKCWIFFDLECATKNLEASCDIALHAAHVTILPPPQL